MHWLIFQTLKKVGLRLLRHCLSFGKMVYSCRTVPDELHSEDLKGYDEAMRGAFGCLTGIATDDSQWAQACRGFALADLGLRSAERHAPAAYVASRCATKDLCREVDAAFIWDESNAESFLGRSLSALNGRIGTDDRVANCDVVKNLRALSLAIDKEAHDAFFESLSQSDRATILSEMLQGASGFLEAKPSSESQWKWEPQEFASEIRRRLLVPVYPAETWCPLCDCVLDIKGHHACQCAGSGDRTARHNEARNDTFQLAERAGQRPELEKPGLLQPDPDLPDSNRRRPADVYLPRWKDGRPAALDLAITNPQRQNVLAEAARTTGAAATAYENFKRTHLQTEEDCLRQGISFIPVVGETSGGWGPSAICTFKALAKAAAQSEEEWQEIFKQHLGLVCTAVRRANARAVLRRQAVHEDCAQVLRSALSALDATGADTEAP